MSKKNNPPRPSDESKLATLPAEKARIRLRVERQLGYKQAKYVMRLEITDRLDKIGGGKGGFWEDRGYEWYAGI